MKCPNCGFETESAFCQMCGTKISEALYTQSNETTETEYTSPLPRQALNRRRDLHRRFKMKCPNLK